MAHFESDFREMPNWALFWNGGEQNHITKNGEHNERAT